MKNCRKGFSTEPSDREKMMRGAFLALRLRTWFGLPRTKPRFAWYRQFTLCSFSTSAQPDPGLSLKKCSYRLSVNESRQPQYRSSSPHCERRWNCEKLATCRSTTMSGLRRSAKSGHRPRPMVPQTVGRRLTASARPGSVLKSLATKVVRPKNQSNGLDAPCNNCVLAECHCPIVPDVAPKIASNGGPKSFRKEPSVQISLRSLSQHIPPRIRQPVVLAFKGLSYRQPPPSAL